MDKEQIKAISESIPMEQRFSVEQIVSAAIESYKAELLKEVGEPEYFRWDSWDSGWVNTSKEEYDSIKSDDDKWMLYPSDQVAAAIAKATKPLEYQLAKAEQQAKELSDSVAQKVAEACASLCDHLQTSQKFGENGYGCEAAIRNGEWRKFVKEA